MSNGTANNFFFIQYARKFACLVSQKSISIMKGHVRPHYGKNHERIGKI